MFTCNLCLRRFASSVSLTQHKRSHDPKRKANLSGLLRARQKTEDKTRLEKLEYYKSPLLCLACRSPLSYYKYKQGKRTGGAKFCNHSCFAKVSNIQRAANGFTTKGLKKEGNCHLCGIKVMTSIHNSNKKVLCNFCWTPYKAKYKEKICKGKAIKNQGLCQHRGHFLKCTVCSRNFASQRKITKCCSKNCARKLQSAGGKIGGRMSAFSQRTSKRSKNEAYFSELCQEKFDLVLNNEPMFNGWDAYVILPNEKVAILWNGPWHFKKITAKHSVAQVQNRDKIKICEIEKMGYTPYVIADHGKHNKSFVQKEFDRFLENFLVC